MDNKNTENSESIFNNALSRDSDNTSECNKTKEIDVKFMKNTLNLCNEIKNMNTFYKIIENINSYLNTLKRKHKYENFLLYNFLTTKYSNSTEEHTLFFKIIKNINSLDIIEFLIASNFEKKTFDILLSSYNELTVIEIKNFYYVLFELIWVLIENLTYYKKENKFSLDLINNLFLNSDLKYISREQVNNVCNCVDEKKCDYMDILLYLLDFCLSLNDQVHRYFMNTTIDCANHINDLVVMKKEFYEQMSDDNEGFNSTDSYDKKPIYIAKTGKSSNSIHDKIKNIESDDDSIDKDSYIEKKTK